MMACITAWRPFGMLANERTASAVRLSRSVSAAHSGERSSAIRRASRPSSAMVLPADALGLVDDLVALALEDDPDRAHRLFLQGVLPVAVARGQVAPGGAGAHRIQNTALMNLRLSSAAPPHWPLWPGSRSSMSPHERSSMSWRWQSSALPPPRAAVLSGCIESHSRQIL